MGWNILYVFIGLWVGFWVGETVGEFSDKRLNDAQSAYTRCVADGAPRDTCIKNYLLPEEKP